MFLLGAAVEDDATARLALYRYWWKRLRESTVPDDARRRCVPVCLREWVADDDDAYVARAVAAARDVPGLAALRQSLRRRFEVSPLRDGAGLARAMEEAYRALWDAWRVGMTLAVAAE